MSKPIGHFVPNYTKGLTVVGPCCIHLAREVLSPVFRENVYPYRQACGYCGALLVAGQTPAWPELHPAETDWDDRTEPYGYRVVRGRLVPEQVQS